MWNRTGQWQRRQKRNRSRLEHGEPGVYGESAGEEWLSGKRRRIDSPLDKLLNDPGQNQTYLAYRADILAIKNYERMQGSRLPGGFRARYIIEGKEVKVV